MHGCPLWMDPRLSTLRMVQGHPVLRCMVILCHEPLTTRNTTLCSWIQSWVARNAELSDWWDVGLNLHFHALDCTKLHHAVYELMFTSTINLFGNILSTHCAVLTLYTFIMLCLSTRITYITYINILYHSSKCYIQLLEHLIHVYHSFFFSCTIHVQINPCSANKPFRN